MPIKVHDPSGERVSAAELMGKPKARPTKPAQALTVEQQARADFRVFLTLLWRFLLGNDPHPIQLDMAYWLQHGPDRAVIEAFRGFSKSWITGAFALWLLWNNPNLKVMVVSGALKRAIATTNWCLTLIVTWPLIASLKPKPAMRQSSEAFDVGPCTPEQSPSFHAMGIGGQMAGYRADFILPDDVETATNSLTVTMRDKIKEAVKEFESVLKPGGIIKYLGTPHDEDSLYNELKKRGYRIRIWPAQFPNPRDFGRYGGALAPWVSQRVLKDPGLIGQPTMPLRFPMDELDKRRLAMGNSEYALQFMLDTTQTDKNKYPLKLRDLMVSTLDPSRGPDMVSWTNDPDRRLRELPNMGFEGDHYYEAVINRDAIMLPWTSVVGAVDTSGRGEDELALVVIAELHGTLFWLHLWATTDGYGPSTLKRIADTCVRFKVHKLKVESNFGDGMFAALLRPVLEQAWRDYHNGRRQVRSNNPDDELAGTEIEECKVSNQMAKEKRMLAILEPVTQQHRLVVSQDVILWDADSLKAMEGEDTRHRYSWGYQFTRLTRDRDSLGHDDRLDALSLGVSEYAGLLGVDPKLIAVQSAQDREDEEIAKLFGDDLEEDEDGILREPRGGHSARPEGMGRTRR